MKKEREITMEEEKGWWKGVHIFRARPYFFFFLSFFLFFEENSVIRLPISSEVNRVPVWRGLVNGRRGKERAKWGEQNR